MKIRNRKNGKGRLLVACHGELNYYYTLQLGVHDVYGTLYFLPYMEPKYYKLPSQHPISSMVEQQHQQ